MQKNNLIEELETVPIIDCHEHQVLTADAADPRFPELSYGFPTEPISFLLRGYFLDDLLSAGASIDDVNTLKEVGMSTEKKWPIFEMFWNRTKYTTYAFEIKETLSRMTGTRELNLKTLNMLGRKISKIEDLDAFFNNLNIKALLVDPWWWGPKDIENFIDGKMKIPKSFKMVIPLPFFHFHPGESTNLRVRNFSWVQQVAGIINRHVTSLEEFLDVVQEIIRLMKDHGAVGIKDQSAYFRSLNYKLESNEKAERLFNMCLDDPNNSLGWPESKALDDYLFHQYMRFASEFDLPVQIHTGHMAGQWNRVEKANVSLLTNVIELHREVKFDLFHGNWPYMGDILFIAKNFPNAYLNLCWVHAMDPLYSVDLLSHALYTVPHSKILGFGGDYHYPEQVPAHLTLCRRNIAEALSRFIEKGWFSKKDALEISSDWLYNNPNRLFKLGLEEFNP